MWIYYLLELCGEIMLFIGKPKGRSMMISNGSVDCIITLFV